MLKSKFDLFKDGEKLFIFNPKSKKLYLEPHN